jgi:hypothetical protein
VASPGDARGVGGVLGFRHGMYGYPYRKTTRFWTNNAAFKPRLCVRGSCGRVIEGRHQASIGQKRHTPIHQKFSYPPELVRELLESTRTQLKTAEHPQVVG